MPTKVKMLLEVKKNINIIVPIQVAVQRQFQEMICQVQLNLPGLESKAVKHQLLVN